MNPIVYRIDFPDGQFYIGATVNFAERRRTHLRHGRKQRAVNSKLQQAFDAHPICCIYQIASGMARDEIHLLEKVMIEQERPPLNVNQNPSKLPDKYSGSNKSWGPHKCIRDAAEALGVTYLAAKRAAQRMTYEKYAEKLKEHKTTKPKKFGPPDPRGNTNLVNLYGERWVSRKDVAQVGYNTYEHRRRRCWTVEEALLTPMGQPRKPPKATFASVCRRYGVTTNKFYARRKLGWTLYEALGLKPRQIQEKPKVQKRMLTHNGVTKPLQEWAKQLGVTPSTIHNRLSLGWSVEKTLTEPKRDKAKKAAPKPKKGPKLHTISGVTGTIKQLSDHFGVPYSRLYSRVKAGWPEKYLLAAASFPTHVQPDVDL